MQQQCHYIDEGDKAEAEPVDEEEAAAEPVDEKDAAEPEQVEEEDLSSKASR
jgi:hypothetical protein